MATTTNFGWETPDDTDLVKDGAAAIRTLGQSIDTSMMDLEGGTTGQVLSKASNADMDFTWVTTDDANAIQNSIVDAKGDLIAATAADTPARLAVGTNGQFLVADSTTATGLKWAAGSSPLPTFSAYKSTNQTYSTATWTKVTFDTEEWDTGTNFASSRFTPTTAGYYSISGRIDLSNVNGTNYIAIYKNGVIYKNLFSGQAGTSNSMGFGNNSLVYFNGSTDYVEIYMYSSTTTSTATCIGSSEASWFVGVGVRS